MEPRQPAAGALSAPETRRLAAVARYAAHELPAGLRELVRHAAESCGVPMAAITLVERDTVRCRAGWGVGESAAPRLGSFCQLVIDADEAVVVPDLRAEPRLAAHPFVTGGPRLRFFAAAPVRSEGETVGTLSIYDTVPRAADEAILRTLRTLATWVDAEAAARHTLAEAAPAVADAARAREEILATVTHEVRTPVSSIQGYLELITDSLDDAHAPFVAAIERNVARLVRTVDQLVLTACGPGGGLNPSLAPIELGAHLAGYARDRVVLDRPARPVHALAEPTLLTRAVENLISNALLFSEPDSPVEVAVTAGPTPAIVVTDHGWGIPPHELGLVRQPFVRGGRARDQHVQGIGLGLTVVDQIAAVHGGELTLRPAPGGGTTAILRLRAA